MQLLFPLSDFIENHLVVSIFEIVLQLVGVFGENTFFFILILLAFHIIKFNVNGLACFIYCFFPSIIVKMLYPFSDNLVNIFTMLIQSSFFMNVIKHSI